MTNQAFKKMEEEVLKDVPGYCSRYQKYCVTGLSDEKFDMLLKNCELVDFRALLGFLAVKVVADMNQDRDNRGTSWIMSNIVDLCKEKVYTDKTCDVDESKIPLIMQLAKNNNDDYYLAKGLIRENAITFLACLNS